MKRKADMGIGTLIIFIAMILVAAIAAGVLIQTATSLQNRALLTGERSQSQVSTSIRPIVIYAEDGSDDTNSVNDFYATLKLAPGSDAVKLEHLLVEFALNNASDDLLYNETSNISIGIHCSNFTNSTITSTDYFVEYLIEGDNHDPGYLQRGDVIKLCFKAGRAVQEDETVRFSLIPRVGSPTVIETAMPDIITQKRVNIFP